MIAADMGQSERRKKHRSDNGKHPERKQRRAENECESFQQDIVQERVNVRGMYF